MTGEILDKVGETENIGEDNDVTRLSPNRLRIEHVTGRRAQPTVGETSGKPIHVRNESFSVAL